MQDSWTIQCRSKSCGIYFIKRTAKGVLRAWSRRAALVRIDARGAAPNIESRIKEAVIKGKDEIKKTN